MITQTWPESEPHRRAVPAHMKNGLLRQMFLRVTNVDGLGPVPKDVVKQARAQATTLVTESAESYAKRYGTGWVFSSLLPTDPLPTTRPAHRHDAPLRLVSDASIDDHIFLTDEAEGSWRFLREILRTRTKVPSGPVGECLLSLMFLDQLLIQMVGKETVLFRLLEAQFWADSFCVEAGHDVRDRLGFAHRVIDYGPRLAMVEEFEITASLRPPLRSLPPTQIASPT